MPFPALQGPSTRDVGALQRDEIPPTRKALSTATHEITLFGGPPVDNEALKVPLSTTIGLWRRISAFPVDNKYRVFPSQQVFDFLINQTGQPGNLFE